MKNKIIGIVICMLLISSTTTLALTPLSRNEQQAKQQFFDPTPSSLIASKGWIKNFGGTDEDLGYSVQQTIDGGYIITGTTYSFGAGYSDMWLIKTDSNGNELWNKTHGGIWFEDGTSIQQTTDGGYIITGSTSSFGAGYGDVWLVKTDDKGNELWNRTFGGVGGDEGQSVQLTTDGGYIIGGYTNSFGAGSDDVWLIRTDLNGKKLWDKTFGGTGLDMGFSAQQTTDGGYIIVGNTSSFNAGLSDVWLIKTDDKGNELWNRTFGGTGIEKAFSVQQTSDDGYIITGWIYPSGSGFSDVWLIKTDSNGVETWNRSFGGTDYESGISVEQTNDGGYIIAGTSSSRRVSLDDVLLIKTDGNGNEIWNRTFGGTGMEYGNSVQQTSDGGYIIVGDTLPILGDSNILLIKTDSQGKSKTTSFNNVWFEWLFQRFPNAFPLQRQLLGY